MSRKKLYASVHIAKSALNLDDDAYRDLMYDLYKVRSASDLSDADLKKFAAHLKTLQNRNGLNTQGVRNEAMIAKCEALWIELRKLGAVKNGDKSALETFIKNKTGAAGLRMANGKQLYKAIEALKSWLERESKS